MLGGAVEPLIEGAGKLLLASCGDFGDLGNACAEVLGGAVQTVVHGPGQLFLPLRRRLRNLRDARADGLADAVQAVVQRPRQLLLAERGDLRHLRKAALKLGQLGPGGARLIRPQPLLPRPVHALADGEGDQQQQCEDRAGGERHEQDERIVPELRPSRKCHICHAHRPPKNRS